MSSRGETFVAEDIRDAACEKYPEYLEMDVEFRADSAMVYDAWSDDQIPERFGVTARDAETGEEIAKFDVYVKFCVEHYDFGKCVGIENTTVKRTWRRTEKRVA